MIIRTANVLLAGVIIFTTALQANDWQLVWADEFDGETLDLAKWSYQLGDGSSEGLTGWGNNEAEYYQEANAVVNDGLLTIIAKEEKVKGYNYTSARIRTKAKGDWKYCRVEIRAKMPIGKGLWAALWMMPTDNVYGGWAASGEMDMVEYLGHEPNKVHGTLHFGGQWPQNRYKGKEYVLVDGDFQEDFHEFIYEWEEGEIRWYVDGNLFQTQGSGDWWSSAGDFPAPFDQRFHIIMNLAVGGNWPGYPDATTQFPQELVIDYVRVYQKTSTDVNHEQSREAKEYGLHQNFPNPFNPQTMIHFSMQQQQHVLLEVFDTQGHKIKTLLNAVVQPGKQKVIFDASEQASGIYLCKLATDSFVDIQRMVLLK